MIAIPPVNDTDAEDVAWGLQTADTLWKRGERIDAIVWLRRAAQAAGEAGDDDRALELARWAAELSDWMATEPAAGSEPPPPVVGAGRPPSWMPKPPAPVPEAPHSVEVDIEDVGLEPAPLKDFTQETWPAPPAARAPSSPTLQTELPDFQSLEAHQRALATPSRPPLPLPSRAAKGWTPGAHLDSGNAFAAPLHETPSSPSPTQETFPPDARRGAEVEPQPGAETEPHMPVAQPSADEPMGAQAGEAPDHALEDGVVSMAPEALVSLPPGELLSLPPGELLSLPPGELVSIPPAGQVPTDDASANASAAAEPSAVAGQEVDASAKLDLDSVEAFADLPDDARAAFAAAANVDELADGEEVSSFGLAYILSGEVDVAATMVDAPAARLGQGVVLRARGTTDVGVPMRLIAVSGAVIATWSEADVESAFRSIPWVEEDLRTAADRYQTFVGITIGPLGERLDMSIREHIIGRLTQRTLTPGEVVVTVGDVMTGLFLVGVGELELVDGDEVGGVVGCGEFLFPGEVLGAGAAPKTARAGSGGAVILFGDHGVAHELLVTCPPLLEVFAGM